jgi:ATP-binding cassette subfamily B protein
VIPQKAFLFSGTIASNLRYGDEDATDEELWRALEIAQARDFVEEMGGLEAPITQGGTNVSGGQRQRLAIARALTADAPVLVLDEPSTGLDAEAKAALIAPLRKLMRDRTTLVISHDLLTTRDADLILVFDSGRVVERGRHEDLVERAGLYARLWSLHQPSRSAAPTAAAAPTPVGA